MRRILTAVLFGALAASAGAADPPFLPPRDRDGDHDRDRGGSIESREQVTRWFIHFFKQQPDHNSLTIWSQRLDQASDPDQVLARMLGDDVYYTRAGSTPHDYVRAVLSDLTGREPSRREQQVWTDRLFQTGGESPDVQDRTDLAYDMLRRYPQGGPPPRADDDYDYRGPGRRPDHK